MANDVGKSIATIRLSDGCVLNFFNRTVFSMGKEIKFYGFDRKGNRNDIPKYKILVNEEIVSGTSLRCAYFSRSFPSSGIDMQPRPVLYVPSVVDIDSPSGGVSEVPAVPLFEFISPTICMTSADKYQISWWSNVDDISSLESTDDKKIKIYDYSKIKKFSTTDLENFKDNRGASKILCTAPVQWEKLCQDGGGVTDVFPYFFPVIRNIVITTAISGEGYITDFSTGGGGGGTGKMHDHTSNAQCGFAAAVFMPSANIRVVNWK